MRPIKAILFEPDCLRDAEAVYEDVEPAFAELRAMGIRLCITSSPSLEQHGLSDLEPGEVMFLTETAEGIAKAKSAGVNPILMMNDPDEAKKLAMHNPAGGVVSLLELPDFIRFVAAESSTPLPSP